MDFLKFLISVCMAQLLLVHGTEHDAIHEDICGAPFEQFPNLLYPPVLYRSNDVLLCSRSVCWKVTYEALKASYGNSFFSILDYSKKTKLPYKCPECSGSQAPSDGSSCCSTILYATYYGKQDEKENVSGQKCSIIHIPGLIRYQMVTEGVCGNNEECESGRCTQMYTVQSLLAWNQVTKKLGQEYFKIPTYCTCMNVQTQNKAQMIALAKDFFSGQTKIQEK